VPKVIYPPANQFGQEVKKSKTGSVTYAGSGHAFGGSAFGTTCSLSPEDDPVGSFKILNV
jgi:hypothetical protein